MLKRVLVYYGWLSAINGLFDVEAAAEKFSNYDIVIIGDGLEHPAHPDYANTTAIIAATKTINVVTKFFGYIPVGQLSPSKLDISTMQDYADEWVVTGADGIFLDEFGYDYHVSRSLQNQIVSYCKNLNLPVIVNAWSQEHVFGKEAYVDGDFHANDSGEIPVLNQDDFILFESLFTYNEEGTQKFATGNRIFEAVKYLQFNREEYSNKTYYDQYKVRPLAVDTIDKSLEDKNRLFAIGYYSSYMLNFVGYGASSPNYGASDPDINHYLPSPNPKLEPPSWHIVDVTPYQSSGRQFRTAYTNDFGDVIIKLIWLEGNPVWDITKGEHVVFLNDIEKNTFSDDATDLYPQFIDDPLFMKSTEGNISVVGSEFQTGYGAPTDSHRFIRPGGGGLAPDDWWYCGGPEWPGYAIAIVNVNTIAERNALAASIGVKQVKVQENDTLYKYDGSNWVSIVGNDPKENYQGFLDAGGQWIDPTDQDKAQLASLTDNPIYYNITPYKLVKLDATDPKVRQGTPPSDMPQNYGLTQCFELNQTNKHYMKISFFYKTVGFSVTPQVNFQGYSAAILDNNWSETNSGGTYLFMDTASTSSPWREASQIITAEYPFLYGFVHMLVRGASTGQLFITGLKLEQLQIVKDDSVVSDNLLINGDFAVAISDINVKGNVLGFEMENATKATYSTPLPVVNFLATVDVKPEGYFEQRGIVTNSSLNMYTLKVPYRSLLGCQGKIIVELRDRFKNILSLKEIQLDVIESTVWKEQLVEFIAGYPVESVDIRIENTGTTGNLTIGKLALTAADLGITDGDINAVNGTEEEITISQMARADHTRVVGLPEPMGISKVKADFFKKFTEEQLMHEDDPYEGIVYITDGNIKDISPKLCRRLSTVKVYETVPFTQGDFESNAYDVGSDTDSVMVKYNGIMMLPYLKPPHLSHIHTWKETGANFSAQHMGRRYYCVTAYNAQGETTKSNIIVGKAEGVNGVKVSGVIKPPQCKVPIEITPSEGAVGYRIYVTEEATPWSQLQNTVGRDWFFLESSFYYVMKMNYPIWGDNCLLDEITTEELREMGYVYYDDGHIANTQQGKPPTSNTALVYMLNDGVLYFDDLFKDWVSRYDYTKLSIFKSVDTTKKEMNGGIYLPNKKMFYMSAGTKLFYHDEYQLAEVYQIGNSELGDVKGWCNDSDEAYYVTDQGKIVKLSDGSVISIAGTVFTNILGIVKEDNGFAILRGNSITKINMTGAVTSQFNIPSGIAGSLIGFSKVFDKYVVFNDTTKKLIFFDNLAIRSQITPTAVPKFFNVVGTTLFIYIAHEEDELPHSMLLYDLICEKYYGEMNPVKIFDSEPQFPDADRQLILWESDPNLYPNIVPNGDFRCSLLGDQVYPAYTEIFPSPPANVPWSVERDTVLDVEKNIIHFKNGGNTQARLYYSRIGIKGGMQYQVNLTAKALASGGYVNITFGVRNKHDKERWGINNHGISIGTEYKTISFKIQIQEEALSVNVDLSFGAGIEYKVSAFEIIPLDPVLEIPEFLENGDMSIIDQGANYPSGFKMSNMPNETGLANVTSSMVLDSTNGNAWRIVDTNTAKEKWYIDLPIMKITAGDQLRLKFKYKCSSTTADMLVRVIMCFEDGAPIQSLNDFTVKASDTNEHEYVLPTSPFMEYCTYDPVQYPAFAGKPYPKLMVRIHPAAGATSEFRMFAPELFVSGNSLQRATNPEFADGISAWYTTMPTPVGNTAITAETKDGVKCAHFVHAGNGTAQLCQEFEIPKTKNPIEVAITLKGTLTSTLADAAALRFNDVFFSSPNGQFKDNSNADWPFERIAIYLEALSEAAFPKGSLNYTDWTTLKFTVNPKVVDNVTDYIFKCSLKCTISSNWGCTAADLYIRSITCTEISSEVVEDPDDIEIVCQDTFTVSQGYIPITLKLKKGDENVAIGAQTIQLTSNDPAGEIEISSTNVLGYARALFIPKVFAGIVKLTATYGSVTATKEIEVMPLITQFKSFREIVGFDDLFSDKLYLEVIYKKRFKDFRHEGDQVQGWTVFRSPEFNKEQTMDTPMSISTLDSGYLSRMQELFDTFPYYYCNFSEYFDYVADKNEMYASPVERAQAYIFRNRKWWYSLSLEGYKSPFGAPDYRRLYNWREKEMFQWYMDRIMFIMKPYVDGIYLDDFWGEEYKTSAGFDFSFKKTPLLNYLSFMDRQYAQARTLKYLGFKCRLKGKYLCCNYGASVDANYSSDGSPKRLTNGDIDPNSGKYSPADMALIYPFDGFLIENFTGWDDQVGMTAESSINQLTNNMWMVRGIIELMRYCRDHGKFIVCLARGTPQNWDIRMMNFALFLMGWFPNAYMTMHQLTEYGEDEDEAVRYGEVFHIQMLPEMRIRLGEPKSDYVWNNYLFSREFDNCIALANASTSSGRSYTLPEGIWYDLKGNAYTGTVTVPKASALVVMKVRP